MPNKTNYIFLDRDGVIIKDKVRMTDPYQIEFLPGAVEGLQKLQSEGYKFILATNQSVVARGLCTLKDVYRFNEELSRLLAKEGVEIAKTYLCPHHPEFTETCECRKPQPGLAQKAAAELGLDPAECIFIGDQDSDTEFGKNCGGVTCLVQNNQYPTTVKPDFTVKNLVEIYTILQTPSSGKISRDLRVAIIIPTINRSEFINRQLDYYASVNCPHPIYIGDSSTEDHATQIQNKIKELAEKLKVVYVPCPKLNDRETTKLLIAIGEEDYVCYIGDDDFQIPQNLTKCAEFLKDHQDYSSTHGRAVTFKLDENKACGKLVKIATYRQPQVEAETAEERLLQYFQNYYVTQFSVHRREQMLKYYESIEEIPDRSFSAELLPCSLSIIDGKSKLLDILSFVRQIHDVRYELPNPFDWITTELWSRSYQIFENKLTQALAAKDQILLSQARIVVRKAFWGYLQFHLAAKYLGVFPESRKKSQSLKNRLASTLPILATLYRKLRRKNPEKDLHNDIFNPKSPYYVDFKPVMDSFSKP